MTLPTGIESMLIRYRCHHVRITNENGRWAWQLVYIHTADGGRTFPKMKECGTAPTLEQAVADGDRARGDVTR